jgi:hypothetical protein
MGASSSAPCSGFVDCLGGALAAGAAAFGAMSQHTLKTNKQCLIGLFF